MITELPIISNIMPANSSGRVSGKLDLGQICTDFALCLQEQTDNQDNPVLRSTTDNNEEKMCFNPLYEALEDFKAPTLEQNNFENLSVEETLPSDLLQSAMLEVTLFKESAPKFENVWQRPEDLGQWLNVFSQQSGVCVIGQGGEIAAGQDSNRPAGSQEQSGVQNYSPDAGDNEILDELIDSAVLMQVMDKAKVIAQNQYNDSTVLPGENPKTGKSELQPSEPVNGVTNQTIFQAQGDKLTGTGQEGQKTAVSDLNLKQEETKIEGTEPIDSNTQNDQASIVENISHKAFEAAHTETNGGWGRDKSSDAGDGSRGANVHTAVVDLPKEQNTEQGVIESILKNAPSDGSFRGVGEQLGESIQSSLQQGVGQITIRLNPPQLGSVTVKFEKRADQITGLLEVSRLQTKQEIQQALPQVLSHLAEVGITIKRLEVVLTNCNQQGSYGGNLPNTSYHQYQNSFAEQANSAGGGYSDYTSILQNDIGVEAEEMMVTDGSINMLV